MNKNALNIAVFISLVNVAIVLLATDHLVTLDNFENDGVTSFINLALILFGFSYAVWLGLSRFADRRLDWFCLALIFQVYLLREADFHIAFTSRSLTKWASYTTPDIPVLTKLVAAALLLTLFMSMSYLLARYASGITRALQKKQAWAVSFVLWAVLLLISQFFDRQVAISGAHWKLTALEELMEVSAAIFAVLALVQFVGRYRNKYKDYFS